MHRLNKYNFEKCVAIHGGIYFRIKISDVLWASYGTTSVFNFECWWLAPLDGSDNSLDVDMEKQFLSDCNLTFQPCDFGVVENLLKVLSICLDSKQSTKIDNICAKCGLKDEYASFCPKYNEVRCYQHCD